MNSWGLEKCLSSCRIDHVEVLTCVYDVRKARMGWKHFRGSSVRLWACLQGVFHALNSQVPQVGALSLDVKCMKGGAVYLREWLHLGRASSLLLDQWSGLMSRTWISLHREVFPKRSSWRDNDEEWKQETTPWYLRRQLCNVTRISSH